MRRRALQLLACAGLVILGAALNSPGVSSQSIATWPGGSMTQSVGGGGVCTGAITPIRNPLNQSVITSFSCSTGWYNSQDAAALYASDNTRELKSANTNLSAIAAKLDTLNSTSVMTEQLIANQITTFNQQMRVSIAQRFDTLPAELVQSDAIRQLKADILAQVDAKIAAAPR
jgi:hypothetical protein